MAGRTHAYATPTMYNDGQTEIAIELTSRGLRPDNNRYTSLATHAWE